MKQLKEKRNNKMKPCPQCGYKHRQNRSLCNKCYFLIPKNREKRRLIYKNYRKNNLERVKEIQRRSKFKGRYGITVFDFEEIFKKQGYKCKICGIMKLDLKELFCLDHNHNNSKIRGVLCKSCNSGLGFFKDDINRLKEAIKYLENS